MFGLGDSSYENFAKTGKDFDSRLVALGVQRLHDRVAIASPAQQQLAVSGNINEVDSSPYTKGGRGGVNTLTKSQNATRRVTHNGKSLFTGTASIFGRATVGYSMGRRRRQHNSASLESQWCLYSIKVNEIPIKNFIYQKWLTYSNNIGKHE